MLNIKTTHLLKCPNGRFSFVGLVPGCLCYQKPATRDDIMGGRAYKTADGVMTSKVRVFDTEQEARQFAAEQGVTLAN